MTELATVGVNGVAGFIVGIIVEHWPRFEQLPPKSKRLVTAIIAGGVAVIIIVVVGVIEPPIPEWRQFVRAFIVGLMAGFSGSQVSHGALYLGKERP